MSHMHPNDVVNNRERIEREINDHEAALLKAAREFRDAEGRLHYLRSTLCGHPKQTKKDGGWQGTATIYDCPDCGRHEVDD